MSFKITHHKTFRDGRLHLYKQSNCKSWMWRACINGKDVRKSTKTSNLALGLSIAENEFDRLRFELKTPDGHLSHPWEEAEKGLLTSLKASESNLRTSRIKDYTVKLNILNRYFGGKSIHTINAKSIEEYIEWRRTTYIPQRANFHGKAVTNKTLSSDLRILRQLLKYAKREEWITTIPEFPRIRVIPRAGGWFEKEEYQRLTAFSRAWINKTNDDVEKRYRQYAHDYMLWLTHTGMRVDEALKIRFKDIREPVKENPNRITRKDYLYVLVREGKLAYRKAPSEMIGLYGAVGAYERIKNTRPHAKPDDLLFPYNPRETIQQLLSAAGLERDESGTKRTAKSFRHTYMMFRLLENVDVYALAQHCRTSVKMIQQHYGSHLTARMKKDELMKFIPRTGASDIGEL